MPSLRVLNSSGDTALTWEDVNDVEHNEAKVKFGDLLRKGFTAFRMRPDKTGEQIKVFDPDSDTVLVPQIRGG